MLISVLVIILQHTHILISYPHCSLALSVSHLTPVLIQTNASVYIYTITQVMPHTSFLMTSAADLNYVAQYLVVKPFCPRGCFANRGNKD